MSATLTRNYLGVNMIHPQMNQTCYTHEDRMIDGPCLPDRMPFISREMVELGDAVQQIAKTVCELNQRIAPILRENQEEMKAGQTQIAPPRETMAPLAYQLQDFRWSIDATTKRLVDMLRRLEI